MTRRGAMVIAAVVGKKKSFEGLHWAYPTFNQDIADNNIS
jgi:hypothetical protein